MSKDKTDNSRTKTHTPGFIVSQEEHEELSQEDRERFKHIIKEPSLTPPEHFSTPEEQSNE
ncbi:hypothetical protein [Microbulbifer epialgicus]|uniref:Uncharacterized protein n=1 Tax=Microbulbifer epialgicus TaxID=393907 RepID=A0ABV4NUA3_9GAMM